jgi:glucokinase
MAILSIAVGSRKISAALVDENYNITAFSEAEVSTEKPAVASAVELTLALLARENVSKDDISFAGAAVCSCVGCYCEVASELESALGMKVCATTKINALALGEAYTRGDVSSAIVMKIGEKKIESSVVIDRKVFMDYAKVGGGLGYFVINKDGYECSCGKKGCLQAYTSANGIRRTAEDAGFSGTTLSEIFDAADAGNENAIAAKNAYVSHLACGLTNIINLFQPEELIIMGSLTDLGDRLYAPLMDIVLREQYTKHSPNKGKVRFSAPSQKTFLIGAALLGR